MRQHVGRITLAVTLIAAGVVLIADNVWGMNIVGYAVRLWPALLILLGLEWVAAASRTRADSPQIRVDGGALVVLVIVGLIMANSVSWSNNPFRLLRMEEPVRMEVPAWVPRTSGTTSAELTVTGRGPVEGLQELTIDGRAGSVFVEAGEEFRVELTVRSYGRDSAEALENARRVQLQVQPGPSARVSATWPGTTERIELQFHVTVPAGVRVKAETSSGSIDIRGRQANVTAIAVSGAVHVRNMEGDAAVTSSSGAVLIDSVRGSVNVNATSGTITVHNATGAIRAQTSSGTVNVTVAEVGGDYDLSTSSGSVRVWLPAAASVKVDARASSGTVSGPAWLTLGEGRGSATGQQGDGARKLTLRTSSGNISMMVQ